MGPIWGQGRGRTGVLRPQRGGVQHGSAMLCYRVHFAISLPCRYLAAIDRPDRAAPAVKGRTGATPPFLPLVRHGGGGFATGFATSPTPPFWGVAPVPFFPAGRLRARLRTQTPSEAQNAPEASTMKMRYPVLIVSGVLCSAWGFLYRPFPLPGENAALDLVLYHTPNFYSLVVRWYYVAPAVGVIVGGLFLISVWRVWFSSWGVGIPNIGMLPRWPLSPDKDAGPSIVVGEIHHPVKAVESRNPKWLIIPERGLYTGVAIFGAVGSGKTSACMRPFAPKSCPGRRAVARTIWRALGRDSGNEIRSMTPCSIPTCWPTPSRPGSINSSALFLGVSPSLVYAYVERKQIPHCRMMGRSIRFRLSELVEWRQQFHVNGGIDEQQDR